MAVTNVQKGRRRQNEVLMWLRRFPALSRQHLTQLVYGGDVRAANASLLSLHRQGLIKRFDWFGQYVYSLDIEERSHLTAHQMAVGDVFCGLRRTSLNPVDGYGEVVLTPDLRADLVATTDTVAVLTEIHMGGSQFEDKFDRYMQYSPRQAAWWQPGMKLRLWIVAAAGASAWLDRLAQPYREKGLTVTVTDLEQARKNGWRELGIAPVKQWKLPLSSTTSPPQLPQNCPTSAVLTR